MGASTAGLGISEGWAQVADTLSLIDERKAVTQRRIQDLLINQQNIDANLRLQQALSGGAVTQSPVPVNATTAGTQDATQPSPEQVATAVQQKQDASPIGIIRSRLDDMAKQERRLRELSRTSGIPVVDAMKFQDHANEMSKTIATESIKLLDETRKSYDYVAGFAGGVNKDNPDSLQTAYSQIAEVNPVLASKLLVDRGTDGRPLPTARTYAAMADTAQLFTKRSEQLTDLHRKATERVAAAKEAENEFYKNERLRQIDEAEVGKNQRAATAQAGIAERAADRAAAKAAVSSPEAKRDKILADFISEWRAKYPFGAPATIDYEAEKNKYFDAHKPSTTPAEDAVAGSPEAAAVIAADKAGKPLTLTVPKPPAAVLPLPPKKDGLVKDKVYQTARGPAKWNGTEFEAQ